MATRKMNLMGISNYVQREEDCLTTRKMSRMGTANYVQRREE